MCIAEAMGCTMDGLQTLDIALFSAGTFAAAFVTGLAGFAFGIIAAAVWLHFLVPAQVAPPIARKPGHRVDSSSRLDDDLPRSSATTPQP